jgi:hypothetical protein
MFPLMMLWDGKISEIKFKKINKNIKDIDFINW